MNTGTAQPGTKHTVEAEIRQLVEKMQNLLAAWKPFAETDARFKDAIPQLEKAIEFLEEVE